MTRIELNDSGALASIVKSLDAIVAAGESFAAGRWAGARITALCVFLSLMAAFPSLEALDFERDRWPLIAEQVEDPFYALKNPPGSPASSLRGVAFRFTLPLAARALRLGTRGILALQVLAGIALFYVLGRLVTAATGDRVLALFFALATANIYAGATSFVEIRGIFDGVALFLLVAAMSTRRPWAAGVLVFAACWTDERALLCSGAVLIGAVLSEADPRSLKLSQCFRPLAVLIALAGCSYLGLRTALKHAFEWHAAVEDPRFAAGILLSQINQVPIALWTGLEGLWLIVVLAMAGLWRSNKWLLAGYGLAIALICLGAVTVVDITRSMAYLLPAAIVALRILSLENRRSELRLLVLVCALACLLWPTYYVGGKSSIWWQYPLPLQFLRWVFRA